MSNFSTVEFVACCSPEAAVVGLSSCSRAYADRAIKIQDDLHDFVSNCGVCITSDIWVYDNCKLLEYMCAQCERYPALRVKFFSRVDRYCLIIVHRKDCCCIPAEFRHFVDRLWRTYIGWLFNHDYITGSDHASVSICTSDRDSWQAFLTPRERAIVGIIQRLVAQRLPVTNGLIADDLAAAGYFDWATGENYHDDTVKRLRRKLIGKLRSCGYFDVVGDTRKL